MLTEEQFFPNLIPSSSSLDTELQQQYTQTNIYPTSPNPFSRFWQEDCKEERIVTFDVVTDKTVVYRKKVVHVMPHLALSPGQNRLAGVPVPTLSTSMRVDTPLLLAEMQNILQFAGQPDQMLLKRKRVEEEQKKASEDENQLFCDRKETHSNNLCAFMPAQKKVKPFHVTEDHRTPFAQVN